MMVLMIKEALLIYRTGSTTSFAPNLAVAPEPVAGTAETVGQPELAWTAVLSPDFSNYGGHPSDVWYVTIGTTEVFAEITAIGTSNVVNRLRNAIDLETTFDVTAQITEGTVTVSADQAIVLGDLELIRVSDADDATTTPAAATGDNAIFDWAPDGVDGNRDYFLEAEYALNSGTSDFFSE